MFEREKYEEKKYRLAFFLLREAFVLIIGLLYKYYYLDISYRVVCLNSEKNTVDSEEIYFFSDERYIYQYNFETEETKLIYEGHLEEMPIRSVSVYGDYLYFVDDSETAHRYNYRTNEDEMLLKSENYIVGMDICNGYLIYRTGSGHCFLYSVTGNTEEPISVESIFEGKADKTNSDIQIITYEGMDIYGYFEADTGEQIIGIRNHENGKELVPPEKDFTLRDGRRLRMWGRKSTCYARYEDDPEWYEITCLDDKNLGTDPEFYEKYMTQEGDEVICLLQKNTSKYGRMWQKYSLGDILFKWNIETGESSILYETSNRSTRIIGYKNGNIYLLHNNRVSVQSVDGGKRKKLFKIPKGREIYYFDWQGDYLIVTGADGEVLKAYEVED